MISNPFTPWTETLQQQTRETIEQMIVTPDGLLHLKHLVFGHAWISLEDLLKESLPLHLKTSTTNQFCYESLEDLLTAGWALD